MAVNIKKDNNSRNSKPDITNLVYGKVPPQAVEMEEAVLGAMLIDKSCIHLAIDLLRSDECFYVDAHKKIYAAILRLMATGGYVDLLTVTEELRKTNELEIIGGAYYLTKLTMNVVSSAHIETHAKIIQEKFIGRELIRMAGNLIGSAYEDNTDVFELMDAAQTELYKISNNIGGGEPEHISLIIPEVVIEGEEQRESNKDITGIPCGIAEVDKLLNGFQKTDLIILSARPAIGKTALSLNIGMGAAELGAKVAIFSLEMGKKQLIKRLASNYANIEASKVFNPKWMSPEQWEVYIKESFKMGALPIYIDDTANVNTQGIRAKAMKLISKGINLELIIIDYLQLIAGKNHTQNENARLTDISRDLKVMAKDLDIPVIALSQLNREGEGVPTMNKLRGSGAIEQDGDVVVLLYPGESDQLKDYVMFDVAKQRNGKCDKVVLEFSKTFQRFKCLQKDVPFPAPQIPENPRAGIQNRYETNEDLPF